MITLNDKNNQYSDGFTKYIYTNENSLSRDFCDKVIELYDKYDKTDKRPGQTVSGVNPLVKTTTDLVTYDAMWSDFNVTLSNELISNISIYSEMLQHDDYKGSNNNTSGAINYKVIDPLKIVRNSHFMIQKYQKNVGRYIYHNDYLVTSNYENRIITYLWYLNDVVEGGETAFSGTYNIRPRCGTLLLFPACWTFPHCGKMPISSDKYIITGWIYENAALEKHP